MLRPRSSTLPVKTRLAAAALVVALTVVLASCGGDGGGDDDGQAAAVPNGSVAVVGDAEITKDQLQRDVAALRRATPNASRAQLRQQALSALVAKAALEQEAAERGIRVSRAEVRRRWKDTAGRQFKTRRALRRFLGGQSLDDTLDQLRLQALSERIHARVAEEAGGGKQGKEAVAEFQRDFARRWQERTACAADQSAAGCPR